MKSFEFFAVLVFLAAIYAAYFFIRHSFIIVSLAPVLGVLVAAMLIACIVVFVAHKFRRKS